MSKNFLLLASSGTDLRRGSTLTLCIYVHNSKFTSPANFKQLFCFFVSVEGKNQVMVLIKLVGEI